MNFSPAEPFTPCDLYQSTPRKRIVGTFANVSTLLITVGLFHRPCCTGNGGLLRGSARLPSIASSSAGFLRAVFFPGPRTRGEYRGFLFAHRSGRPPGSFPRSPGAANAPE